MTIPILIETTKGAKVPLEDQEVTPDRNCNCRKLDGLRPIVVSYHNQAIYNKKTKGNKLPEFQNIVCLFLY